MSTAAAVTTSKPNIGVYTNPEHKLWIADAGPTQEEAAEGKGLDEGQVMLKVRSTGICGFVFPWKL